jgi:hypothetical protein
MTNWKPIESAPKDGREITVRRTVAGHARYEVTAVWRPATASQSESWVDAHTGKLIPEPPTHWKAAGRGRRNDPHLLAISKSELY